MSLIENERTKLSATAMNGVAMASIVAGIIGVAVVFGLLWLIGNVLARRRSREG